jgi:hypothetical protein
MFGRAHLLEKCSREGGRHLAALVHPVEFEAAYSTAWRVLDDWLWQQCNAGVSVVLPLFFRLKWSPATARPSGDAYAFAMLPPFVEPVPETGDSGGLSSRRLKPVLFGPGSVKQYVVESRFVPSLPHTHSRAHPSLTDRMLSQRMARAQVEGCLSHNLLFWLLVVVQQEVPWACVAGSFADWVVSVKRCDYRPTPHPPPTHPPHPTFARDRMPRGVNQEILFAAVTDLMEVCVRAQVSTSGRKNGFEG